MSPANRKQILIKNAAGQYVRLGRENIWYIVVDSRSKGDLFTYEEAQKIGYRMFGKGGYTLEQCTPEEFRFWRASMASRIPSKARREAARRNARLPRPGARKPRNHNPDGVFYP